MAVLSTIRPTLLDLAKSKDPDGKIAEVIEILNQTNEVLDDMSWVEGNLTTGHQTTIRSGLPEPVFRKLNQGVQPTKSTKVQIVNNTAELSDYSEVDVSLARKARDPAEFRFQEDVAHMEGMNQKMAAQIFFGNEALEPEGFTGLSSYYNDLGAENADNIIDAGGTGSDNRSIWLVVWGDRTAHGIIPQGSNAGFQMRDLGETTVENVNGVAGSRMQAFRTYYQWDAGLVLKDWRYVVRIANIDKSDLSVIFNNGTFATGANLPNLLFEALRLIPNTSVGRPAFYMSRDMLTVLFQQGQAATVGSTLQSENVGGRVVESFQSIPLRRVDALSVDEAQVT